MRVWVFYTMSNASKVSQRVPEMLYPIIDSLCMIEYLHDIHLCDVLFIS